MDFTKKDARGAAEVAQFCHLRDQDTGKHLHDDDGTPVGVMVLGAMARSVQEALRNDARSKLQDTKGKSKSEQNRALEDIQKDLVTSASKLTVGFQNVQRCETDANGKIIYLDDGVTPKNQWNAKAPEDCAWFYDLNMFSTASLLNPKDDEWQGLSFAQQVLAFSNEASNYLGNA